MASSLQSPFDSRRGSISSLREEKKKDPQSFQVLAQKIETVTLSKELSEEKKVLPIGRFCLQGRAEIILSNHGLSAFLLFMTLAAKEDFLDLFKKDKSDSIALDLRKERVLEILQHFRSSGVLSFTKKEGFFEESRLEYLSLLSLFYNVQKIKELRVSKKLGKKEKEMEKFSQAFKSFSQDCRVLYQKFLEEVQEIKDSTFEEVKKACLRKAVSEFIKSIEKKTQEFYRKPFLEELERNFLKVLAKEKNYEKDLGLLYEEFEKDLKNQYKAKDRPDREQVSFEEHPDMKEFCETLSSKIPKMQELFSLHVIGAQTKKTTTQALFKTSETQSKYVLFAKQVMEEQNRVFPSVTVQNAKAKYKFKGAVLKAGLIQGQNPFLRPYEFCLFAEGDFYTSSTSLYPAQNPVLTQRRVSFEDLQLAKEMILAFDEKFLDINNWCLKLLNQSELFLYERITSI